MHWIRIIKICSKCNEEIRGIWEVQDILIEKAAEGKYLLTYLRIFVNWYLFECLTGIVRKKPLHKTRKTRKNDHTIIEDEWYVLDLRTFYSSPLIVPERSYKQKFEFICEKHFIYASYKYILLRISKANTNQSHRMFLIMNENMLVQLLTKYMSIDLLATTDN